MSKKLTKDIINARLELSGLMLINEYSGALDKATFECQSGHIWQSRVNNVLNGSGCPTCKGGIKLSEQTIKEKLSSNGITLVSNYERALSKSLFKCSNGHTWEARVDSVLSGTGCNICQPGGFNASMPAWQYLIKFDTFIKYGITNNLNRRLAEHKKYGNFELIQVQHHVSGYSAQAWEQNIKKNYGGKYVTSAVLPNGWTETLPLTMLDTLLT